MPSTTKLTSTTVDTWPLPATEVDEIAHVAPAAGQERWQGASGSGTALDEKAVDRSDTSDSDNLDLTADEKELEVQADTQNGRAEPQPKPAAPPTTTDSTERETASNKNNKKVKRNKKQNTQEKKQDAETDSADTDDQSDSCLPGRRRGVRHGPRKSDKGGRGDRGGQAWHVRVFQKLKMGIFSRKKKSEEANPYAAPITPYQQARVQLSQAPPQSNNLNAHQDSFPNNPPPPYNQSPTAGSNGNRFGDEKYGNQKGYGSNPYDNNAAAYNANGRGPGGYGGFDDDAGKNDLFGGAANRYTPGQQGNATGSGSSQPQPRRYDNDPSKSALMGNAQDRYNPLQPQSQSGPADDDYGGYGAPRELTEEEKEEQEVQGIKDETKFLRKEGVDSVNRSLAIADSAVNTALGTYARLGEQGDRLHRTERNLDAAAAKSRVAEDKTKELKKVNGSMFAVHVSNPFTASKRQAAADAAVLDRHRMERGTREATRKDAFLSNQEMEQTFKDLPLNKRKPGTLGQRSEGEKSKFGFELDSEEEEDEEAIDKGLDQLGDRVGTLRMVANGMNSRVADQNKLLDRLAEKSDAVDDHVRMNREKLSRIH